MLNVTNARSSDVIATSVRLEVPRNLPTDMASAGGENGL